jgi:2-hydroxychromene-2-carboxylate isomerase
MLKTVDYYFSVASPWTYLGSARFIEMARRHDIDVRVLPVDYNRVFAASGGILFTNRAPQRRNYRQIELQRWSRRLGIPLTLEPRFYPVDRGPASRLLIAAREQGKDALALSHAVLRAIWHEELDIADWNSLAEIADRAGFNSEPLISSAHQSRIAEEYQRNTDQAIAAQVFGAPTYIYNGELFWGQDRLDFLEEQITQQS